MDDLVSQLSIYLGGIGLLGLALGWWLGRGAARRRADAALARLDESRAATESELERTALEAAQHASRIDALEKESLEARERAERITSDLIDTGEELEVERQKVASFEALLGKRDRRIEELRAEIAEARSEAAELEAGERQGHAARQTLESELAGARVRIADLQAAAEKSRDLETERLTRARENDLLRKEIERLRGVEHELRRTSARAASHEGETERIRRRAEEAERERHGLASELTAAKNALERLEMERETHGIAAEAARRELATHRQRLEERDDRMAELEAAAAIPARLQAEAEALRRDLGASTREVEELRRRVTEAEEARRAAQEECERVRQEFETLLEAPWVEVDRMATVKRIPVEIRADDDAPLPPPHGPELLEAPRGAADDLGRIRGIGESAERTLNSLGVYYFRQIAAWSDSDVEWVAAHVATLPERIVRDGWREQAAELAREKEPRGA